MSWIDRALSPERGIRFDEYSAFLGHGGEASTGPGRIRNLGRAVGLLRNYRVSWPGRVRWAVDVVKNRGRLQRTTEAALYLERGEELRARFPQIHALVLESWRVGGLRYHGQFAQLLETAELIARSAPHTVLELGSGVSSAMLAQLIGD
ncbi:MAG: hypothetical protein JNK82_29005, partial [Myxococcaceae bacterium]|nr:hypothetical protein [Myxococcaceae bacterium]